MPHGDRTGPVGEGPMTGRGMGYCAGCDEPGFANPAPGFAGRGAGRGQGGRGFRHQFHATGLTGWQRATLGVQSWGRPGRGVAETTEDHRTRVLQNRVERLEAELARARDTLSRQQAD